MTDMYLQVVAMLVVIAAVFQVTHTAPVAVVRTYIGLFFILLSIQCGVNY